jgi:hypothetical protein
MEAFGGYDTSSIVANVSMQLRVSINLKQERGSQRNLISFFFDRCFISLQCPPFDERSVLASAFF